MSRLEKTREISIDGETTFCKWDKLLRAWTATHTVRELREFIKRVQARARGWKVGDKVCICGPGGRHGKKNWAVISKVINGKYEANFPALKTKRTGWWFNEDIHKRPRPRK